jgi:WD40 repeat protein
VAVGNSLVNAADGAVRHTLPTDFANFCSLAFAPDGRTLATGSDDGRIRIWDVATGEERMPVDAPARPARRVVFAPDGREVATGHYDGTVRIWNAATSALVRTVPIDGSQVMAVSPDGAKLACAGQEGAIRLGDWATGAHLCVLRPAHESGVSSIRFTPDGRHLASAGRNDNLLRIWDTETGTAVRTVTPGKSVFGIGFAPGGQLVAACPDRRQVLRWDALGEQEREPFTVPGERRLWVVTVTLDGELLADIDGQSTLSVRRPGRGLVRRIACGPPGRASFAPDGRLLAIGSQEGPITLWELATGQEVLRLPGHRGMVWNLAFARDEMSLASVGRDSCGLIWEIGFRDPGKSSPVRLPPGERDRLWAELADADAAKGYRALCALAGADPEPTVAFLRERLWADPGPSAHRLAELLADLDSPHFAAREAATRRLTELGAEAEPALRPRLAQAPSLEVRRRIERLLAALPDQPLPPAALRRLRAVMALERIGAPARAALAALAAEDLGSLLTEEARASLRRLGGSWHAP